MLSVSLFIISSQGKNPFHILNLIHHIYWRLLPITASRKSLSGINLAIWIPVWCNIEVVYLKKTIQNSDYTVIPFNTKATVHSIPELSNLALIQ